MSDEINYIVTTEGWSGKKVTECRDEVEVWEAIGEASFGALYYVESPTGRDTSEFIPF